MRPTAAAALPAAVGVACAALLGVLYAGLGSLQLGLSPAVALVVAAVPAFALGAAALGRLGLARGGRSPYSLALLAPHLTFLAVFFLIPLGFLAVFAVATPVGFGDVRYGFDLANLTDALDGVYVSAFLRTLRMAALGTLATIAVGLPFAYWLARYVSPGRRGLLIGLVLVPFWTAFLIRTYAFIIVLDPSFALSRWLEDLGLTTGPLAVLNTATAVQIGLVYNYLPLFVLPLYASLERMDWRLVDAATDLGAPPRRAFRQITLRLAAPGLLTGCLLVFIPMMGEYVIPQVLGGGKVDLLGNVIARAFLADTNYPFGAALALLVMAVLGLVLLAYAWASRRAEATYGA